MRQIYEFIIMLDSVRLSALEAFGAISHVKLMNMLLFYFIVFAIWTLLLHLTSRQWLWKPYVVGDDVLTVLFSV